MVVSSYRLSIPNGFDNRWRETTEFFIAAPYRACALRAPSAPAKERGHLFYGAATPPSRRRGICVPNLLFTIQTSVLCVF